MSNFNKAYNITMQQEGGFVNDKTDRGGETYAGISRLHNPTWSGWEAIDTAKAESTFPKNLNNVPGLKASVKAFYAERYWNPCCGDQLPETLSIIIFSIAVNMGTGTAGKYLQRSLNALNRDEQLYEDLIVDGTIGNKTLSALNLLIGEEGDKYLNRYFLMQVACKYIRIVEKNTSQEKYIRGWINRLFELIDYIE